MEEGSTNSRAGRWIKEIFKKKEDGEVEQNDVSDETPAANGHKAMELTDISEEEEEVKDNDGSKVNGNGSAPQEKEEDKEMENDGSTGDAQKSGSDGFDSKEDSNEEDDNA